MARIDDDNRRHSRYSKPICTWLSFYNGHGTYGTVTMDIGTGGARFCMMKNIDENDNVLLNVQVTPSCIECKGKVCWVENSDGGFNTFGVRFLDLSEEDRDSLNRYLAIRESLSSSDSDEPLVASMARESISI